MKSVARVETSSAGRRWFVRRIVVISSRRKGCFLSFLRCTSIQGPSVLARREGILAVFSRVSSCSLYRLRILHALLDCSGFIITRCSLSPRSSELCTSPLAETTCYRRTRCQKLIDRRFICLHSIHVLLSLTLKRRKIGF